MPELPDVELYREALDARVLGRKLRSVTLKSPFVLRTAVPPLPALFGRTVTSIDRIGKRIAFGFDGDFFLVVHLMIAGRLQWKPEGGKAPAKITLAVFDFESGELALTEAGTRKRASLHVVHGREALAAFDPGGLDVMTATRDEFESRLRSENHTLKRSLTDPTLFSGIGNAYSDEILHRAKLSPLAMSQKVSTERSRLGCSTRRATCCSSGPIACASRRADCFRPRSRPFIRRWRCTAGSRRRAPCAARPCSASCTPRTKRTIARAARRRAWCSRIARFHACCTRAFRESSRKLLMETSRHERLCLAVFALLLPSQIQR